MLKLIGPRCKESRHAEPLDGGTGDNSRDWRAPAAGAAFWRATFRSTMDATLIVRSSRQRTARPHSPNACRPIQLRGTTGFPLPASAKHTARWMERRTMLTRQRKVRPLETTLRGLNPGADDHIPVEMSQRPKS